MESIRVFNLTPALAVLRVEGAAQDCEEPCTKIAAALKVGNVGPGAEEGVLHQIIDLAGIGGQGEAKRP